MPQPGQVCPLWSDNSQIHESDVARGAIEAKNEMDRQNPEVKLKHDPAKDINLAVGNHHVRNVTQPRHQPRPRPPRAQPPRPQPPRSFFQNIFRIFQ